MAYRLERSAAWPTGVGKARGATRWIKPGVYHCVRYGENAFLYAHPTFWEERRLFAVRLDGNPLHWGYGGVKQCPIAIELDAIFWEHVAPGLDAFDPVAWVDAPRLLAHFKMREKVQAAQDEEDRKVAEEGLIVLF